MAAPSVSSSGAAVKDRSFNDLPDIVLFVDGLLSWDGGQLKDEDIISVRRSTNDGHKPLLRYTISSLEQADGSQSDSPLPLKLSTFSASTLPEPFLAKHLLHGLPTHLKHGSNALYVLISKLSGTGLALQFFKEILEPLLGMIGLKESDYRVIETQNAESVKSFARSVLLVQANEGTKQTVLLLSGDGGVVDVINGLLESGPCTSTYTRPILSQLPLGTGNALFHSLHKLSSLPTPYVQGLRTFLHGTARPLPIFRATFSPGARALTNEAQTMSPLHNNTIFGAVVASYGLHATLVGDSDTTEYRKHGDKRFGLVANNLLNPPEGGNPHAYKAEVTLTKANNIEEAISRKEHGYILASLVSNLEKAFTISPASRPLDGQLRVVHFGPMDGEQTMEIMKQAYNDGNHVGMDTVAYESVEGLKIRFLEEGADWRWRRCCIDGLIIGVEEGGWMEVQRVGVGDEALDIVMDEH